MAPAVVAVVVADDPGAWFEEAIAALADQDYPNLSILVIDADSQVDVKPRVARAAPGAFVRRIEDNPGFGAAANDVLDVVDGAAFYLMCHDDVAPEPDVVRLLVEEAYRSNAAIVGPKLVRWDDPSRLLQVGEGIDHAGYAVPIVERGEMDQEQHDAVRDVFTVPGACTLVRADLFTEIGGFDEGIDYLLDDVSLCWRAHVAGARVIVAPDAAVRHLEALGVRRPVDDRRRLQSRHRLRVLLSSCSPVGLAVAVPKMVVLNVAEVLYAVLVGRTRQARDVAGAWLWNLRRLDELRGARQQVREFRRVPDSEVRRFMARGSSRFSQFLRGQIGGGDDRLGGLARTGRDAAGVLRSGTFRVAAAVWGVIAIVLLAGSRHLLTRGVPVGGRAGPLHHGADRPARGVDERLAHRRPRLGVTQPHAVRRRRGARRRVRWGDGAPAHPPHGRAGARRRVRGLPPRPSDREPVRADRRTRSSTSPSPCPTTRWPRVGGACWRCTPPRRSLLGLLAQASRLAPFGPVEGPAWPRLRSRTTRQLVLSVGLLTAAVATILPAAVAIVPAMAAALTLGSFLAYRTRGTTRMLGVALGGSALAIALHLPWSIDFLLPGTPLSAFTGVEAPDRGATSPTSCGSSSARSAVLRSAGPSSSPPPSRSSSGHAERHAWAVRGWTLAVTSWGVAWLSQRGDLPFTLPPPDVLLVPAAVGLALATAMGVAAFQVDLPGYRFGWRQIASGVAAAGVALGTLPVLGAAFDGRWEMPAGDHGRALAFLDAEQDDVSFRVLWLGDPSALPLGSWELADGARLRHHRQRHASARGPPRGLRRRAHRASSPTRSTWPAPGRRPASVASSRRWACATSSSPNASPPPRSPRRPGPRRGASSTTLDAQLDLEPLDVPAGLRVYRNQAFFPMLSATSLEDPPPTDGGIAAAAELDLSDTPAVLTDEAGHLRWKGPVPDDAYVMAAASNSKRWQLVVDGEAAELEKPFGWSMGFPVTDGGDATLRFRTPPLRYGLLAAQALAWLLALRAVVRIRLTAPTLRDDRLEAVDW